MHAPTLPKASVLAITFSLSAVPAWAQQEAGITGDCQGKKTINSAALTNLAAIQVTVPSTGADQAWQCVITCSTQMDNPVAAGPPPNPRGELAITSNGSPLANTERNFEHTTMAGAQDLNFQEVSTTTFIPVIIGDTFTLACAARKLDAAMPNFDARRSCITVVCTDEFLQP